VSVAKQFGHNLAQLRRQARLSQEELGERVSLYRSEISRIERGKRIVKVDLLLRLAWMLEVEPSDLLDGLAGRTVTEHFVQSEVPGLGTVHRRFAIERPCVG